MRIHKQMALLVLGLVATGSWQPVAVASRKRPVGQVATGTDRGTAESRRWSGWRADSI